MDFRMILWNFDYAIMQAAEKNGNHVDTFWRTFHSTTTKSPKFQPMTAFLSSFISATSERLGVKRQSKTRLSKCPYTQTRCSDWGANSEANFRIALLDQLTEYQMGPPASTALIFQIYLDSYMLVLQEVRPGFSESRSRTSCLVFHQPEALSFA